MKKMILLFSFVLFLFHVNAQWNPGTNPTTSGNVGIGVSSPTEKLSISSGMSISGSNTCTYSGTPALHINWSTPTSANACINFTNALPNIMEVYENYGGNLIPHLVMDGYGRFILGGLSSNHRFRVNGNSYFYGEQSINTVSIANRVNVASNRSLLDLNYLINQSNNPYLLKADGFYNNTNTTVLAVKNEGKVGINVENPEASLSVNGAVLVDANDQFDGTINANDEAPIIRFGSAGSGEAIGSIRSGSNQWGIDFYTNYTERMHINNYGQVSIGHVNTPSGYKLFVEEGIMTEQIKVAIATTNDWSDFVFTPSYKLKPLKEVEAYIKANRHLPEVPSADEVVKGGINLGKMDATLLQKIEELTLYTIELEKELEALKQKVNTLEEK